MKRFEHDLFEHSLAEYGLAHCRICGGAEGSLPTLCPERSLTAEELHDIYASKIDFNSGPMVGAQWWRTFDA